MYVNSCLLPTVVYDVDGVIYNIVEDFCKMVPCPVPECYGTHESKRLIPEQADRLHSLYRSADAFAKLRPVIGAHRIFDTEVQGRAVVHIESNNFNQDVRNVKNGLLTRDIPNINWHHVALHVVSDDQKTPVTQAALVVEDKPENLRRYPESTVCILIEHEYNVYGRDKRFICVPTLNAAIDVVEYTIDRLTGGA